jgi:hypothetical protein
LNGLDVCLDGEFDRFFCSWAPLRQFELVVGLDVEGVDSRHLNPDIGQQFQIHDDVVDAQPSVEQDLALLADAETLLVVEIADVKPVALGDELNGEALSVVPHRCHECSGLVVRGIVDEGVVAGRQRDWLVADPELKHVLAGDRTAVVVEETQLLAGFGEAVQAAYLPLADDCPADDSLALQVDDEQAHLVGDLLEPELRLFELEGVGEGAVVVVLVGGDEEGEVDFILDGGLVLQVVLLEVDFIDLDGDPLDILDADEQLHLVVDAVLQLVLAQQSYFLLCPHRLNLLRSVISCQLFHSFTPVQSRLYADPLHCLLFKGGLQCLYYFAVL